MLDQDAQPTERDAAPVDVEDVEPVVAQEVSL
jgi:hypothetical protein